MPRQRRLRKVVAPPNFKGYKPYGARTRSIDDEVELLYEEYEAIKLADYDLMNHAEASKLMGVSRATFARIYESARRKISKALVETRAIKSIFGNAELDGNWFLCRTCNARFTIPDKASGGQCPICKSKDINALK